jgi:hypothetical protein
LLPGSLIHPRKLAWPPVVRPEPAAAALAGVPRTVFLTKLAEYGVDTFRLTEAELQQETRLGSDRR